jgi:hypothetical protein
MIYAIGLRSDLFQRPAAGAKQAGSGSETSGDETGGGYFELEKSSDLAPTFTRIASELHSQYVLGFAPPRSTARSTA